MFGADPEWGKFKGLLLAAAAKRLGPEVSSETVLAEADGDWRALVARMRERLSEAEAERVAIVRGTMALAMDSELLARAWIFDPQRGWRPPA